MLSPARRTEERKYSAFSWNASTKRYKIFEDFRILSSPISIGESA